MGPELGACRQGPGQRLAGVSVGHQRTEVAGGCHGLMRSMGVSGVWGHGGGGDSLLGRFWKEPDLPAQDGHPEKPIRTSDLWDGP